MKPRQTNKTLNGDEMFDKTKLLKDLEKNGFNYDGKDSIDRSTMVFSLNGDHNTIVIDIDGELQEIHRCVEIKVTINNEFITIRCNLMGFHVSTTWKALKNVTNITIW